MRNLGCGRPAPVRVRSASPLPFLLGQQRELPAHGGSARSPALHNGALVCVWHAFYCRDAPSWREQKNQTAAIVTDTRRSRRVHRTDGKKHACKNIIVGPAQSSVSLATRALRCRKTLSGAPEFSCKRV
eukprot:gene18629-biopygen18976